MLAALGVSCLSSLSWSQVQDSFSDYRPSTSGKAGSMSAPTFRQRVAAEVWRSVVWAPQDSALRSFLLPRVSSNQSPSQLVIATPGSPLPPRPLSPDDASGLLSDFGLVEQVSSQLLGSASPPPPRCQGDLSADKELVEMLSTWISPLDYPPAVVSILCELKGAVPPQQWRKYRALAVAIALVHDQLLPSDWPHSQVSPSSLPPRPMSPLEKFRDLVTAASAGRLRMDPSELEVGDLMHVVDHRLPQQELEWLRERYGATPVDRLAQKAYADVNYDKKRESSGQYSWPAGQPYGVADIAKAGGICVDQAFYSAMACKALGIPSASFSGAGDDGGHAWVGYRGSSGWKFDVGRPTGEYIVGRSAHPQSWVQVTDHDMAADLSTSSASRLEMWLSRLFALKGDRARSSLAAAGATALAPESPSMWREGLASLGATTGNSDPDKSTKVLREMLRKGKMPDSVKSEARIALADLEFAKGNVAAAKRLEKSAAREESVVRADLGVEQMAASVRREIEAKRPDRAMVEYRRSISKLPEGSKGEYFYAVVVPLVESLATGGSRAQAIQAAKLARQHLSPKKGTLLDRELSDVEKRAYWAGPQGKK